MNRCASLKIRDCRRGVTPSRVRMAVLAEKLDKRWCELRRHATMVEDPKKLLWLKGEFDKRKRRAEASDNREGH